MKQYATIGFIAAVAVLAIVVGTRTTQISGRVMAARIHEQLPDRDLLRVECEDKIPVRRHGARFVCTHVGNRGNRLEVEYEMSREGSLRALPFVQRRRRP